MKKRKDLPFIITISYLAALIFIRLSVVIAGAADTEFARAAEIGQPPGVAFHVGRNIILFGYHVHHFFIGVFLICLAGWLAIVGTREVSRRFLAVMYGAGLGLFFDEIGLLLTWGDYYSRLTYLLSLFLAGIFLNIIFFHSFWESVKRNLARSRPDSVFRNTMLRSNTFIRIADFISDKTGKTERTSLFFTGFLYLVISYIVFSRPAAVRYWVALIFIIQGLDYLVKFFGGNGE